MNFSCICVYALVIIMISGPIVSFSLFLQNGFWDKTLKTLNSFLLSQLSSPMECSFCIYFTVQCGYSGEVASSNEISSFISCLTRVTFYIVRPASEGMTYPDGPTAPFHRAQDKQLCCPEEGTHSDIIHPLRGCQRK